MRMGADRMCMPAPTLDQFVEAVKATVSANRKWSGAEPINLVIENEVHRAVPGGVGNIKAIGNYAMIMNNQEAAKANGFDDVLYLDAVHNKYLEESLLLTFSL